MGRDRIRRLMQRMGIESLSPKPGTSKRYAGHPVYPYLLRGLSIDRTNQVWATGNGYHLHSAGQRVHVPGCHHGLGQQKSTRLELVQHT